MCEGIHGEISYIQDCLLVLQSGVVRTMSGHLVPAGTPGKNSLTLGRQPR